MENRAIFYPGHIEVSNEKAVSGLVANFLRGRAVLTEQHATKTWRFLPGKDSGQKVTQLAAGSIMYIVKSTVY